MEIALLFLPLLASIISGFFGKYIGDKNSEIITSVFVSISSLFLNLWITPFTHNDIALKRS